jgi:hypothetical protein
MGGGMGVKELRDVCVWHIVWLRVDVSRGKREENIF